VIKILLPHGQLFSLYLPLSLPCDFCSESVRKSKKTCTEMSSIGVCASLVPRPLPASSQELPVQPSSRPSRPIPAEMERLVTFLSALVGVWFLALINLEKRVLGDQGPVFCPRPAAITFGPCKETAPTGCLSRSQPVVKIAQENRRAWASKSL
jgi:hypothetical protein